MRARHCVEHRAGPAGGAGTGLPRSELARQCACDRVHGDFTVNAIARCVELAEPQIGAEAVKIGIVVGADCSHFVRVKIDIVQAVALDLRTDYSDERGTLVG